MMPVGKLARLVVKNTLRSPRHFALSSFGITIGIAAFVFLLALVLGVRSVIVRYFPLEQVEVIAPRAIIGTADITKKIGDAEVAQLKARPEVKDAIPRMQFGKGLQAYGYGSFEGSEVNFEVGGFADGIDPSLIADDEYLAGIFRDWEAEPGPKVACEPKPEYIEPEVEPAKPCADPVPGAAPGAGAGPAAPSTTATTPPGTAPVTTPVTTPGTSPVTTAGTTPVATPGTTPGTAPGTAPGTTPGTAPAAKPAAKAWRNTCPQPDRQYCDPVDRMCHTRVPVLISPVFLELYNAQIAPTQNLPSVDQNVAAFIAQRGLGRMSFTIVLGDTAYGVRRGDSAKKTRRVEAMMVGVSPKAMRIGMTMPLPYLRRWNQEYLGDAAASTYSSVVVNLRHKDRLAVFSEFIEKKMGLRLEDSLGQQFATAIFVVGLVFFFISLLIVVISAINIAHNFFVQISERRRELGVLRAVGATPGDVRLMISGESALIGFISGIFGCLLAWAGSLIVDWIVGTFVPKFAFKPTTMFSFEWWILAGGLAFSVVFCVAGGFLPARRAARMQPAQALAQN